MTGNTAMNAYLKRIKKNLHCSNELKQIFLSGLCREIEDVSAGLDMSFDALQETFGIPEVIASEFLETLDEKEHQSYVHRCNQKKIIVATLIVCIIVTAAVYLIDFYNKLIYVQPSNAEVIVNISVPRDPSEEELVQFLEEEN